MEQVAGVVGGRAAFLGGHAVIVHRHQHLHVADELHNGEDTDGNVNNTAVGIVAEVAVVAAGYALRDAAASTAAVASAAAVDLAGILAGIGNAGIQDDRLGDLYVAAGQVAGRHRLWVAAVGAEFAAEDFDAALAAAENNFFLENGDAADGVAGRVTSGEYVNLYLKEEGQVAGVIAFVERQGLHVDVGRDDFDLAGANTDRMINQHLILFREIHPQIFKAVLVRRYTHLDILHIYRVNFH